MQNNFRDCSLDYLFSKSVSYILWHVGKNLFLQKIAKNMNEKENTLELNSRN